MKRMDRLWLWLAAGLGVGYLPGAPGTYGAGLAAIGFYVLGRSVPADAFGILSVLLAAGLPVVAVALGQLACKRSGLSDPKFVVVDEIAGQWISLSLTPPDRPLLILAAFLLFRFFDILKPFPIGRLEHLPGGFGVVLDDVMAGVYSLLLLQAALRLLS